jgi:hypothetical protein
MNLKVGLGLRTDGGKEEQAKKVFFHKMLALFLSMRSGM